MIVILIEFPFKMFLVEVFFKNMFLENSFVHIFI